MAAARTLESIFWIDRDKAADARRLDGPLNDRVDEEDSPDRVRAVGSR